MFILVLYPQLPDYRLPKLPGARTGHRLDYIAVMEKDKL